MIKKTSMLLGIIVAVVAVVIIGFLVSTQSGLYKAYIKMKNPEVIFISSVDLHAVTKYALISYFRKDPSICERLERPYKPLAPEESIDSQRDICRGQIKDIQMLVKTFDTKNSAACIEDSGFRSGGPIKDSFNGYAFIHEACARIAATTDINVALREYLAFIPDTKNFNCDSDADKRGDICHEYAESTDRLIQLYHLLEQNPNSITL